jgi:type IV pilus assembly protein PilM
MNRRRFLGIDVRPGAMCAVALLQRLRQGPRLAGGQGCDLSDGLLRPGRHEANIRVPRAFVSAVRELLRPLADGERRVALVLPDHCGYTLVLSVDSAFRTRREGRDILAWQLGNLLPGAASLELDFQVLRRSADGSLRVLVVAVEEAILGQYEELLAEAGFCPVQIGFHGLELYRHLRYRLDSEGDAVLLVLNGEGITVQYYQDGILGFYRFRPVGAPWQEQIRELHRLLAGCRRDVPGLLRARIFLYREGTVSENLLAALAECFNRPVQVMDGAGREGGKALADGEVPALAAALGAAERLMTGG